MPYDGLFALCDIDKFEPDEKIREKFANDFREFLSLDWESQSKKLLSLDLGEMALFLFGGRTLGNDMVVEMPRVEVICNIIHKLCGGKHASGPTN